MLDFILDTLDTLIYSTVLIFSLAAILGLFIFVVA